MCRHGKKRIAAANHGFLRERERRYQGRRGRAFREVAVVYEIIDRIACHSEREEHCKKEKQAAHRRGAHHRHGESD